MDYSDSELIAQVIVMGNKNAFGRLVNKHQSVIRSLLKRLTNGNMALVDDLAQETFLQAFKSLKSFKGTSKFSSWLYRIAYNKFLEDVRKPHNKMNTVDIEESNLGSTGFGENSRNKLDIEKALMKLNEKERAALTLNYTMGLSSSEVSNIMALPLGTVKSHILRGKNKLKLILDPSERKTA